MIGTHNINNDIWIFLENNQEFQLLKNKIIFGKYINSVIKGKLELKVTEKCTELAKYEFQKNKEKIVGIKIEIHPKMYYTLVKEGEIEIHLGYAHINITKCGEKIQFKERLLYDQLKTLESQC
ncbi:MAG: hypothetical protein KKB31_05380 [Nanoarchaeota archaeon]|nr:hypothetical protein [Nanoarchaeota archaeon]